MDSTEIAAALAEIKTELAALRTDTIERLDQLVDSLVSTPEDCAYLSAKTEARARGETVEGDGESDALRTLRKASETSRPSKPSELGRGEPRDTRPGDPRTDYHASPHGAPEGQDEAG
jgi:hypothetical protein